MAISRIKTIDPKAKGGLFNIPTTVGQTSKTTTKSTNIPRDALGQPISKDPFAPPPNPFKPAGGVDTRKITNTTVSRGDAGQTVKFDKSGNAEVTRGGVTTKFSKQEYADFIDAQSGRRGDIQLSDKVGNALAEGKTADIKQSAINKLKTGGTLTPIEEDTIAGETETQTPPNTATFKTIIDGVEYNINTTEQQQIQSQLLPAGLLGIGGGGIGMNTEIAAVSSRGNIGQDIATSISNAAQIFDAFEKALGNRKIGVVVKAETEFSDAQSVLEKDIEMVKLGQMSYYDAERDFENARLAINRLEKTNTGLNKYNLRYFLDNGAELQASIRNEKKIFEQLRIELESAKKEAKIAQIKQRYAMGG